MLTNIDKLYWCTSYLYAQLDERHLIIISTAKSFVHYSKCTNKFKIGKSVEIKEEKCTNPRFFYSKNDVKVKGEIIDYKLHSSYKQYYDVPGNKGYNISIATVELDKCLKKEDFPKW